MPNLNRVMVMGNLTRDPELRYTPNNTAVVSFSLAVNRRFKDPQGEWREETDFIDCEMFGRRAEIINQYVKKGRPLFVEGRLKLDRWEDRDGNKRSKLKVVAENFEFIDGGSGGGSGASSGGDYDQSRPAYQPEPAGGGGGRAYGSGPPPQQQQQPPHPTMEEDDIPF